MLRRIEPLQPHHLLEDRHGGGRTRDIYATDEFGDVEFGASDGVGARRRPRPRAVPLRKRERREHREEVRDDREARRTDRWDRGDDRRDDRRERKEDRWERHHPKAPTRRPPPRGHRSGRGTTTIIEEVLVDDEGPDEEDLPESPETDYDIEDAIDAASEGDDSAFDDLAGALTQDWNPMLRVGAIRIQAKKGIRAAIITLRPGLYIIAEIPEAALTREEFSGPLKMAEKIIETTKEAFERPKMGAPMPYQVAGPKSGWSKEEKKNWRAEVARRRRLARWEDAGAADDDVGCDCKKGASYQGCGDPGTRSGNRPNSSYQGR